MHNDRKVEALKRDIENYRTACLSSWPAPSDYTRLIDAQYALQEIQEQIEEANASERSMSESYHSVTTTPPSVRPLGSRTRFIPSF